MPKLNQPTEQEQHLTGIEKEIINNLKNYNNSIYNHRPLTAPGHMTNVARNDSKITPQSPLTEIKHRSTDNLDPERFEELIVYLYYNAEVKPTFDKGRIQYVFTGKLSEVKKSNMLKIGQTKSLIESLGYEEVAGEQVLCTWLETNYTGIFARYVYIPYLDMYAVKANAMVGAVVTGNIRPVSGMSNPDWYSKYDVKFEYKKNIKLNIKQKQFIREAITHDHHTLMRPEEVVASVFDGARVNYNKNGKILEVTVSKQNDMRLLAMKMLVVRAKQLGIVTEATVATFFLYFCTAPTYAVHMLLDIMANASSPVEFRTTLKLEGAACKQLQHYLRSDLNYIFELNVLFNRMNHDVDWQKELDNRTTKMNVVNLPYDIVYKHACSIFKQARMEGKRPKTKEWKDYWQVRWAAMPTGSFVSQYQEDIEAKKLIPGVFNRNKTTVLSSMKGKSLEFFTQRPAMIYASTSTKYEWDKVRALYGCDITSYVLADFSMGDCESCLPNYFPVGDDANADYVQFVIDKMKESVPLCYDYDDFNSQHSKSSMKAVVDAWLHAFMPYLSPEQLVAGMWTSKSIEKLVVNFSKLKQTVEVDGTLYSGWRHTSFVNSVLNRVYLLEAGLLDCVSYSIHNGDDVFAACPSIKHALTLISNAEKLGIRAQTTKMNIGTIAEFLRVDGRAVHKTGAQYLTRACTTAVHSRIESTAIVTMSNALDATRTRIYSLVERGAPLKVIEQIEKTLINRWANYFEVPYDECIRYYNTHLLQGGWSKTAEIQPYRFVTKSIEVPTYEALQVAEAVDPGAQDYLNHIAEKYGAEISQINRNGIRRLNIAMAQKAKVVLRLVPEDRKNVDRFRALYHQHRDTLLKIHVSKLRLMSDFNVIIPGAISQHFISYIRNCEDISTAVTVLT